MQVTRMRICLLVLMSCTFVASLPPALTCDSNTFTCSPSFRQTGRLGELGGGREGGGSWGEGGGEGERTTVPAHPDPIPSDTVGGM
jgi:hypothetical protein